MQLYSEIVFPAFYDLVVRHRVFDQRRAGVLAKVRGAILEIGAGTGLNLDFYPESVREITVVEPNPGMKKRFEAKARGHRIKADFHLCGAENMPFGDESFDTVVSTIALCSIPSPRLALLEIKRVLKPDGLFLFLDHGLSDSPSTARLQNFINPLWKHFGAGCQLNRDHEKDLREAGFSLISLDKYSLPKAPKFIGFVYEGVAIKGRA